MKEAVLYVTRHGQTDANLEKRVQGQGDTPLNATGLAQAGELADWFARHPPVAAIYSSDLPRARQTAEILAERLGVSATYHPALRARQMGDYEGRTHEELAAHDAGSFKRLKHDPSFVPPGGGESTQMLMARMVPFVTGVAEAHPGEGIIILSHHKVCQLIVAELAGGEMRPVPNARPVTVTYAAGRFRLRANRKNEEVTHGAA